MSIRLPVDLPARYVLAWFAALIASTYWSDWAQLAVLVGGAAAVAVACVVQWLRRRETLPHRIADAVHAVGLTVAIVLLLGVDLSSAWTIVVLVVCIGGSTVLASTIVSVWGSGRRGGVTKRERAVFTEPAGGDS